MHAKPFVSFSQTYPMHHDVPANEFKVCSEVVQLTQINHFECKVFSSTFAVTFHDVIDVVSLIKFRLWLAHYQMQIEWTNIGTLVFVYDIPFRPRPLEDILCNNQRCFG